MNTEEDDDAPLEGGYYDSEEVPAPEVPKRAPAAKFTHKRAQIVLTSIREGIHLRDAALRAGITLATVNRWRRDPRLAEFSAAFTQARIQAKNLGNPPAVVCEAVPAMSTGSQVRVCYIGADRARTRVKMNKHDLGYLAQMFVKFLPEGCSGVFEVEFSDGKLKSEK